MPWFTKSLYFDHNLSRHLPVLSELMRISDIFQLKFLGYYRMNTMLVYQLHHAGDLGLCGSIAVKTCKIYPRRYFFNRVKVLYSEDAAEQARVTHDAVQCRDF